MSARGCRYGRERLPPDVETVLLLSRQRSREHGAKPLTRAPPTTRHTDVLRTGSSESAERTSPPMWGELRSAAKVKVVR